MSSLHRRSPADDVEAGHGTYGSTSKLTKTKAKSTVALSDFWKIIVVVGLLMLSAVFVSQNFAWNHAEKISVRPVSMLEINVDVGQGTLSEPVTPVVGASCMWENKAGTWGNGTCDAKEDGKPCGIADKPGVGVCTATKCPPVEEDENIECNIPHALGEKCNTKAGGENAARYVADENCDEGDEGNECAQKDSFEEGKCTGSKCVGDNGDIPLAKPIVGMTCKGPLSDGASFA